MKFTLIVCTYMRPKPVDDLLASIQKQTVYPDEILIIDGSRNLETQKILEQRSYPKLNYYLVDDAQRGLTKQRNYGIARVQESSEIVFFLDDDTLLEPNYFEEIIDAFQSDSAVVGVGGIAINENFWKKNSGGVEFYAS